MGDIATQAVADMRSYQAALKNLADAFEIHHHITGSGSTDEMVSRLRERATNLSLTDQKVLAACSAGSSLDAQEQASVARDIRLGDSAIHVISVRQAPEISPHAICARCQTAAATTVDTAVGVFACALTAWKHTAPVFWNVRIVKSSRSL